MSLFSLDDVFGYQDANDNRTMQYGTTAPSSPGVGELWIDTSSSVFVIKRYNGSTWDEVTIPTVTGGRIAGQIGFPATQNPSTDVNTLDDYEEGTWTMGIAFGGGTTGITYVANTGNYIKIGKLVIVTGLIMLSNKGSSTGIATITGLPFLSQSGNAFLSPAILNCSNLSSVNVPMGKLITGTTTIEVQQFTAGTREELTNSHFTNITNMMVSLSYIAST